MRSEALREATAKAAQRASPKLKTRLSRGEKSGRKRIAEVGAVYEIKPAPRTAAEVLTAGREKTLPAPKATRKWLTASVVEDAASVVADIFDEAERRDPTHQCRWVALVDGNNHQIDRIKAEAKQRKLKVTIIVDFVHVLESGRSRSCVLGVKIVPEIPPGWVTLKQAATILGIARQTVLDRVRRGELQAVHVKRGRRSGLAINIASTQHKQRDRLFN
jgi:hypothetical protein